MAMFDSRDYWETRLSKDFSFKGVGYARLGLRYNQWLYRLRARQFQRKLAHLPLNFADARVLDIGSGTGFYVEQWRQQGVRAVTGSDWTDVSVRNLRETYRQESSVQIIALDITAALPDTLDGAGFDIISMFDVIFHIVDDSAYEQAVQNIYRLLAPGGLFIFSDYFLHHTAIAPRPHTAFRSLSQTEAVLRDTGFVVQQRFPLSYLMVDPLDTRRRLWRWLWYGLAGCASLHEAAGFLVGAALYPLEDALIARCHESPGTEVLLCQKPLTP